jgi:hypothetical protein
MQYKRTVTRIGPQLPRWFLVEQEFSARANGMIPCMLALS